MTGRRILELGAIGTAAGLFSGLFGVGGGAIIVPMLMLRMGYADRRAMGTSLVAWLQQRVAVRTVRLLFAGALVAAAIADLMLVIAWQMARRRPREAP